MVSGSLAMWGDKRYHTLDWELKNTFGEKVIKLSLDGGFTCPNRDGTLGTRGCTFCGEEGSGDFTSSPSLSLREQIRQQKRLLAAKWPRGKYLAYFQNFTNTYAPASYLDALYKEALAEEDIVGLAIATRPDCLPGDVLDLLARYAEKTYLWVELGLQTINPSSAEFIRRGFDLECFQRSVRELSRHKIRVVVHLIFGLPGETEEDYLEAIRFVARLGVWGVKLHLLHIQRDTDLYHYYQAKPFPLLGREQYIGIICDSLELLPPGVVIHRLTGDGNKELLEAPKWSLDKLRVLSGIDRELRDRDSIQGKSSQP
ncbi:MAG TPA: TIGR01212 family radical SAM protein [Limnochordia bacterium]|nr:TIGR01212 family radical SAM protein [Limnochordia bacterium]